MDLKRLSREDKEKAYIHATIALQDHWGNPLNGWPTPEDLADIRKLDDSELERRIKDATGLLRTEKYLLGPADAAIKWAFYVIIILSVLGLLFFGIRQISQAPKKHPARVQYDIPPQPGTIPGLGGPKRRPVQNRLISFARN